MLLSSVNVNLALQIITRVVFGRNAGPAPEVYSANENTHKDPQSTFVRRRPTLSRH